MEIDAIGLVTHSGRSTGTADGKIIGTKDKILYATGSTTCLIMQLSNK
jgi:acyl-coenzyme A thioesterase PaaI-like protein